MNPDKILFVDDETTTLKYFERLVAPLAPVLTAASVAQAREVLDAHGNEVAVLITDQRMPGERGNELLHHVREHYPHIVRMLTTAYADMGEAVEAINRGEIFRYISKPWQLEQLKVELRTALELAAVRFERDSLLREKLLVRQAQLRGERLVAMSGALEALRETDGTGIESAMTSLVIAVLGAGSPNRAVDWSRWDQAEVMQAEASRLVGLVAAMRRVSPDLSRCPTPDAVMSWLARQLGAGWADGVLVLPDEARDWLPALLDGEVGSPVDDRAALWLAGVLRVGCVMRAQVPAEQGWCFQLASSAPLSSQWLSDLVHRLHDGTA